jgi:PAS domain S-box-containing protein
LQGYQVLQVIATLVPVLLFAIILFSRYYHSELARIDEDLQGRARELTLTVDRDLQGLRNTLQTLSIAQLLARRDFEAFHRQATRIRDFIGADILLRDRSGQQIINTRVPFGTSLPPAYAQEGDGEVVKTKRPFITNVVIGGVVQRPLYAITVPVVEQDEVVFFLHLSLELHRLMDILSSDVSSTLIAGVFDRNFKLMARSDRNPELVNQPASSDFVRQATKNEGTWYGVIQAGGMSRVGFSRSAASGWWVWVSIPESVVQSSLRNTLWTLAAIGAALTALALLIAYLFGRRFAGAIGDLSQWADALGRGDIVSAKDLPVREFNDVGHQIASASTKRRDLERQLVVKATQESEQRFQMLVQGVTDYAIIMLDPQGYVTNWNSGARRIKGYEQDEIVGQNFSRFYTDEDRQSDLPELALKAAAAQGRYESEGWRVRKDSTKFWASAVLDAIFDEKKKLVGFAKITRDITEKREAQQQLESAREQLYQSQKMDAVGQLTGGVAHDFNNLLTIIIGNLEIAKRTLETWKDGAKARLARAIDQASFGARRAETLTGHLLAFSRRQPLDPKLLDVNKLLNHISQFLKPSLGEKVELQTVGTAGLWQIEADPVQLEAALLNLAVNARDAMPNGGKLTVEAGNVFLDEDYCHKNTEVKPGQYVLISLTDNGFGMSKEVLDRAFDPFFTTKQSGQGTGLGLSQMYGFVKQSGGHVKIYSEPNHGTSVKLYLPRAQGKADDAEQTPFEDALKAYGNETILLVEDDDDVRGFISETLRDLNYRVLEATDAKSALRLLESLRIDLLLTDVILPGENGRELAQAAMAREPRLRVLFMTGYSRNAIVHQGRLDVGVELMQKPVTQLTLATRIRSVLDRIQ